MIAIHKKVKKSRDLQNSYNAIVKNLKKARDREQCDKLTKSLRHGTAWQTQIKAWDKEQFTNSKESLTQGTIWQIHRKARQQEQFDKI